MQRRNAIFAIAAGATQGVLAAVSRADARRPESLAGAVSARRSGLATHPGAAALVERLAQSHGLPPERLWAALAQARHQPQVVRLIAPPPPGQPKNWRAYRDRFVEPVRIAAGVAFWRQQRAVLTRIEHDSGVPAALITGILGVETIWGRHMGGFVVLDALATLALDFPPQHPRAAERAAYFAGEFAHFVALMQRDGRDLREPRGSYAGAMGMAQFMPGSLVHFAVDGDGDGRVDLARSAPDAMASVANFLLHHGWTPGMATHFPVRFDTGRLDLEALLAPDILPTFRPQAMAERGVLLDEAALAHPGKLALVELQMGREPPVYVAGTENFYAITRYNWSSYYAMAVLELGAAVAQAMETVGR